MIGTITLNPSIDQNFTVDDLVKDDVNRALSVRNRPGGKGLNVSMVVRELGGRTRAFAIVGGFSGEYWKNRVRELGVPYTAMRVPGETRMNAIFTDVDDRTQTRVSAPGPRVSENCLRDFLTCLIRFRPRPRFWALGGSISHRASVDTYRRFVAALQRDGVPCILDADNEALARGVLAKPYLIKPNEFEFTRLMGKSYHSIPSYVSGARQLVRRGVRVVVVSLAERGAVFVSADRAFHVPAPKVRVKSKVGAGDSLIGGLATGLARGLRFEDAARLGVAASSAAVMGEAPRLCRAQDVRRLYGRTRVRPIG